MHTKFFGNRDRTMTAANRLDFFNKALAGLMLGLCFAAPASWALEQGITEKTIRIGANLPLEGDRKVNGLALKRGIEAALANQHVRGLQIEYVALNDFYDPAKSVEVIKQLIDKEIFATLGNYGTPTVKATLPLLAEHKIPVVAPYTGAAFTGPGEILNFRASTASEVESVVDAALAAGVKPSEVCAFVQNDSLGMNGVKGVRSALAKQAGTEKILAKLDQLLNMSGDAPERNGIGPLGVYQRDTTNARDGYLSLKKWETDSGNLCRLVATTGVYDAVASFMAYARYKNEAWVFSSVSTAAGSRLQALLKNKNITDNIITTQVVPPLTSSSPVVSEARKALGENFNEVSLEGYLDAKLMSAILQAIEGPLTRENFLKAARRQPYDLGGLKVDFTGSNQGANLATLSVLKNGQFASASPQELAGLFANSGPRQASAQ
ncbi:MAG: ABC transporter substrate-binding protein [Candidatus Competibacteraceae bacterium]|nr:ABC transporter substrate-binding protein [Candidatus Competibacteraceae bacterium]